MLQHALIVSHVPPASGGPMLNTGSVFTANAGRFSVIWFGKIDTYGG
jgi:hypothetical protein